MDSVELSKYIRKKSIEMCSTGKSSHIGSILSCADLISVIFAKVLLTYPKNPLNEKRDRFILSKGHAGAGLYSVLAKLNFVDEELLKSHYQNGSYLSGHVCHKIFPGVEISTGSLGHGLPIAVGKAIALKLKNNARHVYCLMSDGELDEGSNWEAILSASHYGLDNLTAIIDRNRLQSIEDTELTLALEPLQEKFKSFNWNTKVIDGHNHDQIESALIKKNNSKPTVIIANTIKGKGVSFMENKVVWHYRSPSLEDIRIANNELK